MASSPRMPRMSRSCLKFNFLSSIVSRVWRPTVAYVGTSFTGISACSRRSARSLVRMSPNTTVAIFPSTLSTRPTEVRPLMRTVSPAEMTPAWCDCGDGTWEAGRWAFSFSFSFLRFSFRSRRSWICRIFFDTSSSFVSVSRLETSCLKSSNDSRTRRVSSFAA